MKLKWQERTMGIGMGLLWGRYEEYANSLAGERSLERKFWVSLAQINPWFNGYYLGYNQRNGHYVVEWRNPDLSCEAEDETVISLQHDPENYYDDDAKILVKVIKRHRKSKR